MPYTPDATNTSQPADTGVLASTAAAEFRTLKTYIATGLTKSLVGLGNVDNTSDANKQVSTATATALAAKATVSQGTDSPSIEATGCSFYDPFSGGPHRGAWSQIGKLVKYSGNLTVDLSGSTIAGTDTVKVLLPVAVRSAASLFRAGTGVLSFSTAPSLTPATYGVFALRAIPGTSTAEIIYIGTNGVHTELTANKLVAAGSLNAQFDISYQTN